MPDCADCSPAIALSKRAAVLTGVFRYEGWQCRVVEVKQPFMALRQLQLT
jgi:hypothetical protein